MRVGIIGAGATGLAAAYKLCKAGHQAVVFERAPFLGGQASTFDVAGARLERGYHHIFTSDTDILNLAEEIGLGNRMCFFESKVGTLYDGKIYNFVTPTDLLKFTPLTFINRVRLGMVTLLIRRIKDWHKLESITASEWLRKYAGSSAYDVFWGPMLRGKFGEGNYHRVTMAWVWGKINTRFASRNRGVGKEMLGYPIGSFGEIFDTLAERIAERGSDIHLSTLATRVEIERNTAIGLRVTHSPATWTSPHPLALADENPSYEKKSHNDDNEPTFEPFDAVISTTPSYAFEKLVPSLPNDYGRKLVDTSYMAAVLIILVLKRPLSHVYWLNVADRSIPFVGVIEHTNMVSPEHYGGKHIVYLSNYLSTAHPLYNLDHQGLLDEYVPHLRKINPDFDPSWIEESYYHRVDAAQPIIGVDYSAHMPDHRTPIDRLYLANTTQVYPEDRGTNYSVRMGTRVAQMVMDDLKAPK